MKTSRWPDILTWSRIAAAPALAAAFYLPLVAPLPDHPGGARDILATAIFLAAAFTDFLDGFLARKLGRGSRFGAFLDPVADKILMTVALLLLVESDRAHFAAAAVIICREICVSALREWMADIGQRRRVNVSALGKWKTAAQMTAIALLFFNADLFGMPLPAAGKMLLWAAAALTVVSMLFYLRAAWSSLGESSS